MDRKIDSIVIGADHFNTLWLVRSLGMAHLSPVCIIIGKKASSFVGASRYCKDCYIVSSFDEALVLMQSTIKSKDKLPVIASGDESAAFLDENFEVLSHKYILHECNNKGGLILHWMDKGHMLQQALASGLTIPYTRTFSLEDDLQFNGITYPCLLKPEMSAVASKKNFRICRSAEELKASILDIKANCKNVLLQEYIRPKYEYLVYGVRTPNGDIIIPGGLRKIHTCSDTSNMGMMSFAYCSEYIPSQLGGFNNIKIFLDKLDYHGVFSMEFMITEDKAYFLEINLRNDGTIYCTTQAGVNIPALWVMSAKGKDISKMPHSYKREQTYCMNEINYIKYTLRRQSFIKSVSEILKTKAFSLIKLNDMKPVLAKLLPSIFAVKKVVLPPPPPPRTHGKINN